MGNADKPSWSLERRDGKAALSFATSCPRANYAP
jgi:hypothetical protein